MPIWKRAPSRRRWWRGCLDWMWATGGLGWRSRIRWGTRRSPCLRCAARAAAAALRATKGALIVTGSNACFLAGGGGALYTASKFALRGLVLQLANEFAPDIRVNGVAPGATNTGISGLRALGQEAKSMNADPDRIAAMQSHIPLRFVSAPEAHTGLYVLLASREESAYITGTLLVSDGGLTSTV